MERKLLTAVQILYEGETAVVRVSGVWSCCFELNVGLKQGCVLPPCLFSIYIDGVMREMKERRMSRRKWGMSP